MNVLREPNRISVITEEGRVKDTMVSFCLNEQEGMTVYASATQDALCYVILQWDSCLTPPVRILTDDWERSYGTLEWRGIVPDRKLPWYFLVSHGDTTYGVGVKVRPNALCYWQVTSSMIQLVLDVRNGGCGVQLQGRKLDIATIVSAEYVGKSAFLAAADFCSVMCSDPLLPPHPVYGSNNWYYAYGKSSAREILQDTSYLAELTQGLQNRPYMIIDDGWQINDCAGPWHTGNTDFPNIKELADRMSDQNVRPGIWTRLLHDRSWKLPREWNLRDTLDTLDPSHPAVLNHVGEIMQRFSDWGFQMVKHDFSVYDTIGHFAFNMPKNIVGDGWHFYDRSRTTAEIMKEFYRVVLRNAGQALIMGCCVMNHLCAGYVHINRIGNDTSGKEWGKTRFCGVNALAFKLFHHNKFYAADADCAGLTELIPWEMNVQWLDLLAKSSSPLFVSSKKGVLNSSQMDVLREAYRIASIQDGQLEPIDWMDNTIPSRWLYNGTEIQYQWYEKTSGSFS